MKPRLTDAFSLHFEGKRYENKLRGVASITRNDGRALELIEAILREPFIGIGKPGPLKYLGAGVWSRRLTQEHRVAHLVSDDRIDFLQCRHY